MYGELFFFCGPKSTSEGYWNFFLQKQNLRQTIKQGPLILKIVIQLNVKE